MLSLIFNHVHQVHKYSVLSELAFGVNPDYFTTPKRPSQYDVSRKLAQK